MREHLVLINGPLKRDFLLGKIHYKGQSAGNGTNYTESSETTRGAYVLKNNLFKYWFIGFLEGKGSLIINKNNELEFKIVHESKDASVLFYIKKELGFGVVRPYNKDNHCYKVSNKTHIFNIISILNGNIFFKTKQKEFKAWLEAYNKKYGTDLTCLKSINKPELSNSWLSGFSDAVGTFSCLIKDESDYSGLVKLSFTLTYPGGEENSTDMTYLAELLKGKTHFNNGKYETTVNTNKLHKIVHYFSINPLKTNKLIPYLNIKKIYFLIKKNNKNLTSSDVKLINRYKITIDKFNNTSGNK